MKLKIKSKIFFSAFTIFFITSSALCIFFIKNKNPKYEVSVCAIFKDEAPFLKEWIEFHRIQGVKHFFLYNNRSKDNYLEVLDPYLKSKKVTLVEWNFEYQTAIEGDAHEWLKIQTGAYTHCLKKYGHLTKWLAAIDVDEFLYCPDGKRLPFFLKDFERYGGIVANWLLFGTSDVYDLPPNSLMIDHLVKCSPIDEIRNRQVKSIIQPKRAKRCRSAHEFVYKKGYYAVNALGDTVKNLLADRVSQQYIRINHYWTRTEKHFAEHKIRSRNVRRLQDDETSLRERCKNYNQFTNTDILQFSAPLRNRLFPIAEVK